MKTLRPVIDVKEIPPLYSQSRSRFPSLRTLISTSPTPNEDSVLSYLSQGVLCGICYDKGLLLDVLQPKRNVDLPHAGATNNETGIGANLIYTDGAWLWPGALLYYVKEYHLQLPLEFVRHAECQQWQIDPTTVTTEELNDDAFYGIPQTDETVAQDRPLTHASHTTG